MADPTPRRFTGRAGKTSSRRLGRLMEGAVDSTRTYGNTIQVDPSDGRLEVKLARGETALQMTKDGLVVKQEALGEMNRPQMNLIKDLASGASTADAVTAINSILSELRRTGNMRGGSL